MKLKLTLTAVLMLSAVAAGEAAAQCAVQPSCASLGYTLTSTSNCIGAVLRCPFDTSRLYCTQKSEVTSAMMPSFSNSQSRSCGVTYTAASDGYIFGYEAFWDNWNSCMQESGYYIRIQSTNVRLSGRVHGNYINNWIYPVKKGYSYIVSCAKCNNNGWALYEYRFVPL